MATKVYVGQSVLNPITDKASHDKDNLPTVVRRQDDKVYFLFNKRYYRDIMNSCYTEVTSDGIIILALKFDKLGLREQIHLAIRKVIDLIEQDYFRPVSLELSNDSSDLLGIVPSDDQVTLVLPPFAWKELHRVLVNIDYDMVNIDFKSISKALADNSSKVNYLSLTDGYHKDDGSPRLAALFAVLAAYGNHLPPDLPESAIK
ncbi:hypothetical protein LJC64_04945 [Ruminococcaceae bacterium OttesenSCG-928-A11]|nr:hypothetical protein [Ruminococcaceae bacterium OttesenSCG-928-A11]